MRIVFAGTPEVALPSLNALIASDHEVIAVVTRADAPQGRGRTLRPSPVAARAQELGLEVLKPVRPKDPDFVARLTDLAPDCCPVVAYGALVPQHVIDIPRHGWVNLHFSLLPAWRGAAPVQHAVMAGDPVTGASTFSLVAELDAGPVYATLEERIRPDDTSGDLLQRLSETGATLLLDTINGIQDGSLTATPQPSDGITLAPKITVEDARVDFNRPAETLDRLIRGCTPAPGAWTLFRGDRFKIGSCQVQDPNQTSDPGASEANALTPGELEITKRSIRVGTATTPLVLGQIQAQGKKAMAAADWARGITFEPGERLGG